MRDNSFKHRTRQGVLSSVTANRFLSDLEVLVTVVGLTSAVIPLSFAADFQSSATAYNEVENSSSFVSTAAVISTNRTGFFHFDARMFVVALAVSRNDYTLMLRRTRNGIVTVLTETAQSVRAPASGFFQAYEATVEARSGDTYDFFVVGDNALATTIIGASQVIVTFQGTGTL